MTELQSAKSWVRNVLIETLKHLLQNAETMAEMKAINAELNRLQNRKN